MTEVTTADILRRYVILVPGLESELPRAARPGADSPDVGTHAAERSAYVCFVTVSPANTPSVAD
jgi:hypothetical protein